MAAMAPDIANVTVPVTCSTSNMVGALEASESTDPSLAVGRDAPGRRSAPEAQEVTVSSRSQVLWGSGPFSHDLAVERVR